jgi:hypothetical protein
VLDEAVPTRRDIKLISAKPCPISSGDSRIAEPRKVDAGPQA